MTDIAAPEVSFVTTVFRAADHVERAVRSLQAIEGPWSFEILLWDDGSDDDTPAICRRLAEADPRIRFASGGRLGRARALNRAIGAARGRYIAILDADDVALPWRLEATLPLLEGDGSIALVCSRFALLDETRPLAGEVAALGAARPARPAIARTIPPARLYLSNPIVHSTTLFRRADWERVGGYDERLDICIDYAFFFRLLGLGRIAESAEITCLRHRRAESYFARKSRAEYAAALAAIRAEARRRFPIPLWARLGALKGAAGLCLAAACERWLPRHGTA